MITFLEILQIVLAVALSICVLLHSAKGDGIGAIGGGSQVFKSTSHLEKTLTTVTWVFAVLLLVISALFGWGIIG